MYPVSEVPLAHPYFSLFACTQPIDHSNTLLEVGGSGESLCPVEVEPRGDVWKHDLPPKQIRQGDPRGFRIVQEYDGAVTSHGHSVKPDSSPGNTNGSRVSIDRVFPVQ